MITSIGMDANAFREGLARPRPADAETLKAFDPAPLNSRFAGEIVGFDPKKYLSKDGPQSRFAS